MRDVQFTIEACTTASQAEWLKMRIALWPDGTASDHERDLADLASQPHRYAQFIAYDLDRAPVGFLELCFRQDYVNGTDSSPVAFVEGLYTVPARRRQGIAAQLMRAAENCAREHGCTELASDALLDNLVSHKAHKALGFSETERVVYFRKSL